MTDFWNAAKEIEVDWVAENGVSMLMINTEKGHNLIEQLAFGKNIYLQESNLDTAMQDQTHLSRPVSKPVIRDKIYVELNSKGYRFIEKKYLRPPKYLYYKISAMLPKSIKSILKGLMK